MRLSLKKVLHLLILATLLAIAPGPVQAQDELAASLEVLNAGVEVQRVGTTQWVPIKVESLVGQGDAIKTDATGKAIITFFNDGTAVELEPDTEYQIVEFTGDDTTFTLRVEVLAGITRQQLGRLLDPGSSYEVLTPGASMTARGTDFSVRVEASGRSSVLTYEGLVGAEKDRTAANIAPGYGLRAEVSGSLSDVVPATTFDELDAALDGCAGAINTPADVRLNVRLGPDSSTARVGSIGPDEVNLLIGTDTTDGWYRIPYRGGYGWVSGAAMDVQITDDACTTLPVYASDHLEDAARYSLVSELEIIAVVVSESANLRTGPGLDYEVVDTVESGTELAVLGRNEATDWLRVRTDTDDVVWIASFLVRVNTELDVVGMLPVEIAPELPNATTPEEPTPEDEPVSEEKPAVDDAESAPEDE